MSSERFSPKDFARKLRREASKAEGILWKALRNRQLEGFKFVRQEPLGPYIVDFLCRSARLAVELDGATHSTEQEINRDQARTAWLNARGYRVIRFRNEDVYQAMDWVAAEILQALKER
ncbi:MAG: endonuclease domain-containing protein [Aestuariivirga sp.]|uniref:endonuclease domain-containing protein n=1 Tax=Aestuariivirga sp. TaxID=2650926 RepID=UPI0038CFB9C2